MRAPASRATERLPIGIVSGLNERQAARVAATFSHVDELLHVVDRLALDAPSPFSRESPDVAPQEARLLHASASRLRARMLAALDILGIPRPEQTLSARWSVQTTLTFATIGLSELSPATLRGYGALDESAWKTVSALVDDLQRIVGHGRAILHEEDAGGLTERMAGLSGIAGTVLRALARLSADRGLVQLRPLITAAVERATTATFDIGIFGRVSAGKSALINALAGADVLPVGATPITAVPVRVTRGDSGAIVEFVDGGRRTIHLDDLSRYVSELENPNNVRGVRTVVVTVPSVPPGIRFLDTPGVGSLTADGPAQAFAWLPRCDLGLVLVAAATPVGRDELALVAALDRAGIDFRLLVSKSDLLAPAERDAAARYVAGALTEVVMSARRIEVQPVSVLDPNVGLEALQRDLVIPLAGNYRRAAQRALHERLRRLITLTAAALDGVPAADGSSLTSVQQRRAAIEAIRVETDRLANAGATLFDTCTDVVTEAWHDGRDAAAILRARLIEHATRSVNAVRQTIEQGMADGQRAERRVPPLFDPAFLDSLPELSPPRLGRRSVGRLLATRRLAPIREPLGEALRRYATRLNAWGVAAIDSASTAGDEISLDSEAAARDGELGALATLLEQSEDLDPDPR